ncbi:uncharacterized protein DUF938 [Stella humosa]|uniref:Uncharacterized protein DUF938 n=1 Tax=Stella humosa TaxID=94 RepID=A0A3N1MC62_9PROT|nr:DUF938 domain-containing protein [Stella humosa]ROQ01188.1 uncharacterized protein DUF938 [Stella humosa]BBK31563.1 SAM-dependent methyltransferase [Stella humosa]
MSQPRHAPATARNRDAILAVLVDVLPPSGLLLEIASGTGEHAAYMAARLPGTIEWQPTDGAVDSLADIDGHARAGDGARIRPALLLDVTAATWPLASASSVLCCNMIHIAPWAAAEGLFAGAARTLDRADAPLLLYGPFRRNGVHTATSNAEFDRSLQARDARWGVRCLESEVLPLASRSGFRLDAIRPMPANNLMVMFRRSRD